MKKTNGGGIMRVLFLTESISVIRVEPLAVLCALLNIALYAAIGFVIYNYIKKRNKTTKPKPPEE